MRSEELESILKARFDLENAEPGDIERLKREYDALLENLADRLGGATSSQVRLALNDRYRTFVNAQKNRERVSSGRLR